MQLTDEQYHLLVEESTAWRNYVKNRLTEGFVRDNLKFECVEGDAVLRVHDSLIITPFGKAQLLNNPNGFREYRMRQGDSIVFDREVRLTIS